MQRKQLGTSGCTTCHVTLLEKLHMGQPFAIKSPEPTDDVAVQAWALALGVQPEMLGPGI